MFRKYSINKLSILYPVSRSVQVNGDKRYVVITNASYTNGGTTPVGPIMLGGKLVVTGGDKTLGRGGVGVLQSGKIFLGRLKFTNTDKDAATDETNSIQTSFSKGSDKVVDFIGGGALALEAGIVSSESDMFSSQKFFDKDHNSAHGEGYDSAQLRGARTRVAIGSIGSRFELIIISGMDSVMAANALKSTYANLVIFDGGNGFWAHDNKGYNSPPTAVGANSTGFGVI